MRVFRCQRSNRLFIFGILFVLLFHSSNCVLVNGLLEDNNSDFNHIDKTSTTIPDSILDINWWALPIKDMKVGKEIAYLLFLGLGGVKLLDISNPKSIKVIETTNFDSSIVGECKSITGSDSYIFFVYDPIDYDPNHKSEIRFVNTHYSTTYIFDYILSFDFRVEKIVWENDLLYILGYKSETDEVCLQCYSVLDPYAPILMSEYNYSVLGGIKSAEFLAVNEMHAYFTYFYPKETTEQYLSSNIIDFTNLLAPIEKYSFTIEFVSDIIFDNDLMIINKQHSISFYQCTNNTILTLLSKYNCGSNIVGIDLVENYLYVVTEMDFRILDITNNNSVTELDRLKNDDLGLIQVKNGVAYITKDKKSNSKPPFLYSFDVSNPEKIKILYSFYYLNGPIFVLIVVICIVYIGALSSLSYLLAKKLEERRTKENSNGPIENTSK